MIIIPEIETVVILVPRTGSGALKRAVLERYPKAMLLYRHMEADGVPAGYDRWRRFGVCRHPVDRLWSLYKFLKGGNLLNKNCSKAYAERQISSADRPFEDWLLNNEVVFTNPYSTDGSLRFSPAFNVLHSIPENRKSQYHYLRPDLGTRVFEYADVDSLAHLLKVKMDIVNNTQPSKPPALSEAGKRHVYAFFSWELGHFGYSIETTETLCEEAA